MAAPTADVVTKVYQNPHATLPLHIPILVLCNTSDEQLAANIRHNAALDLPWVKEEPATAVPAVMVGGGPSAADCIVDIKRLADAGAAVYAMNGASRWLRKHGIVPVQVLSDAQSKTAALVDPEAGHYLVASQCAPETVAACDERFTTLWHLEIGNVEQHFPAEKVKRGGYALIGGGAATGNAALCVAYALGHREFHVFGYDSSHREGRGHAYSQPMNDLIPTVDITYAGRTFTASVAMKAQAEKFQITSQALKQSGCTIHVYGDGLLQHMYRTPPEKMTERDKYRAMWQHDDYRTIAPGEALIPVIKQRFEAPGPVIDFGCGTGRASVALAAAGYDVILVDFADNCRDDEALALPFLEWDLAHPNPLRAPYGICADVMEHIPRDQVDTVIGNIMEASAHVLFQISLVPDSMGVHIGQPLHLTVEPAAWWLATFERLGFAAELVADIEGIAAQIAVKRED